MLGPNRHPAVSRKLRPDVDRDPHLAPYQRQKKEDQMGDEDHLEIPPGERQYH